MRAILYYSVFGFLTLIFVLVFFFLFRIKKKIYLKKSLEMVLFEIRMPKYEKIKEEPEKGKEEIAKMEQFLANFLSLKQKGIFGPPARVALEIASQVGKEDVSFYIAVPSDKSKVFEKYVHGVYPEAVVKLVPEDYTIFEPAAQTKAAFLTLEKSYYFPIQSYQKLASDPLGPIVNSFTKIKPDDGLSLQIILKPHSERFKKNAMKILEEMRKGEKFEKAKREVQKSFVFKLISAFIKSTKKQEEEKKLESQVDETSIEAIKEKIQKPTFEANIRAIACSKEKGRAQEILSHLLDAFSQFHSIKNSFKIVFVKERKLRNFIFDYSFRNFKSTSKEKLILNLEEIASIYHFPSLQELAGVKWERTKEVPLPSMLPEKGLILIGKAIFRGQEKLVYFATRADRRRHFYIVGQTGTGKTSLLREMIRQDIENGEGVGVIDPHGDLIEDTLANIPKERAEDVVLFEPFDTKRPIGLNMLEWETAEQKDFAVSEMIIIFSKLFPPEIIGPMFEHYMRNAMLALMADKENPGTLVEIPRIFTDENFMRERLEKVTDPLVRNFWLKEWAQTTGRTRSDMLGYVVSKVGRFVENEMMRNIIGQSHSGFNLSEIMQDGKIFLANLSKGLTGELNSSLLGLILVSKMQIAAMRRALIPQEKRRDFYLYIDEFQNFTTDTIATILSEARKYRLNLILAHQFIP